jgi:hypothetical protein
VQQLIATLTAAPNPGVIGEPKTFLFTANTRAAPTAQAGCCVTVGREGAFPTLRKAIDTLVRPGARVCLCMLDDEDVTDDLIITGASNTHISISGSGRAPRLRIQGRLVFSGFGSVRLSRLSLSFERARLGLVFDTSLDVRIEDCEIRAPRDLWTDLITVSRATRAVIVHSTLVSVVYWDPIGITGLPAIPLSPVDKLASLADIPAALAAVAVRYVPAPLDQRNAFTQRIEEWFSQPQFQQFGNRAAEVKDAVGALRLAPTQGQTVPVVVTALHRIFFGDAIVLADGAGDVSIEDSLIVGSVRCYGTTGALDDAAANDMAGRVFRGEIRPPVDAPGRLQFRGNKLSRVTLDQEVRPPIGTVIIPRASGSLSFTDNAVLAWTSSLLGGMVHVNGSTFPDRPSGIPVAHVIATVASAVGNLAPEKRTIINRGVPDTGWELAANHVTIMP